MTKRDEKIFVIAIVGILAVALYFIPIEKTYLGLFFEPFIPANWDEILDRNIVKNVIPIVLLETITDDCKVHAPAFDLIIDHQYFKRAEDLANALNYDREKETLILPCDTLYGEQSKLHVWYVLEESPKHSKKYRYFVTPWNGTLTD